MKKHENIYISCGTLKQRGKVAGLQELIAAGFTEIELTGGFSYQVDLLTELKNLQKEHQLNFLVHNYFPPPEKNFVFNLASDSEIRQTSVSHALEALSWAEILGSSRLSFHAGFLFDIPENQLGKSISRQVLISEDHAKKNFIEGIDSIKKNLPSNFSLYVENNVISAENYLSFNRENPFLFTCFQSWQDLGLVGVKPLLDIAHLKVSCQTLGLDFEKEFFGLIEITDYVHISDNDGKADLNQALDANGEIYRLLKQTNLTGKTLTLELFEDLNLIKESYNLIVELLK
jgi:sugar phosphate isomerase/epimerase